MAQIKKTIWVENSPESLLKLATRYCIKNKEVFTEQLPCGSLKLLDSLYLPLEICESLFQICHEEHIDIDDNFTNIFADSQNSKLRQLTICNASVSDNGMRCLLAHSLKKISVTNCVKLTTQTLEFINECSDNLISISVDNTFQIFPDYLSTANPDSEDDECEDDDLGLMENMYEKRHFILKAPRLKNLCIKDLYIVQGRNYFNTLCKALPNLTHLDLSGLMHSQGLQNLKFLLNCPHLVSLILHNVKEVKAALNTLCQMKKVEHLDISQFDELYGDFDQPAEFLEEIIFNLPALKSLDISGTNLVADYSKMGGRCDGKQCDIPGLARRIENPLEFLGLYKTHHEASRRQHIPAHVISGNSSEEQMLIAGRRYHDRPMILENVLDDLMMMIRHEACKDLEEVVDITILSMERYQKEKKVQINATAILHYLLPILAQNKHSGVFNVAVKKRMMGVLLDTMVEHKEDTHLMMNGCMVLWQFKVPEDLLCLYERVVEILLYIGEYHSVEGESHTIQRAAVLLLNGLVCHVDGEQKRVMGIKIIDTMLRIVRNKLQFKLCDDVMETAWSAMWNVTDETPANSERFLDKHGMELFLKCKETFPNKLDLLRNMMGLLGNVAEVKQCRKRLMTSAFVEEFSFLLDSLTDGIEVSYNAAGVLSHMASDGPEAWTIACPARDHVLERLVRAVNRWDINTNRNINYRSLSPIISLLSVTHTRECQLWATWALANLTKFDENKYCPLVEQEGGLKHIQEIIEEIISEGLTVTCKPNSVNEKLINLGQRAVTNIEMWKKRQLQVDEYIRNFQETYSNEL